MEYNQYNQCSYKYIRELVATGQDAAKEGRSVDELVYGFDGTLDEFKFVCMGYDFPNFEIGEIREFYRIGEPADNGYGCYKNSWNHADDCPEAGVSVVTTAWLNSLKSVFFNTTDENIKARGVYKIRGFVVPGCGGDDEILICPMDWAVKTRIRTRSGLAKAVKAIGM